MSTGFEQWIELDPEAGGRVEEVPPEAGEREVRGVTSVIPARRGEAASRSSPFSFSKPETRDNEKKDDHENELKDDKVVRLEVFRALREKMAAEAAPVPVRGEATPTGIAALDAVTGGLRRGGVSEFSGSTGNGGLVFAALLATAARERWHLALIDAGDMLEPGDWDAAALRRVLWVRCRESRPALRAADLLVRDGNLPLVILDVQGLADRELRRIPTNVWHRLQRVVEPTGVALVVLSRWPIVEGARLRVTASGRWGLAAMRLRRLRAAGDLRLEAREKVAAVALADGSHGTDGSYGTYGR